jgi:hypothetical protein
LSSADKKDDGAATLSSADKKDDGAATLSSINKKGSATLSSADNYQFGFLSPASSARLLIFDNIQTIYETMRILLPDYLIAENMIMYSILSPQGRRNVFGDEKVPQCWDLSHWEWHESVEVGDFLSRKTLLLPSAIPVPKVGWNDMVEGFRGAQIFQSAAKLRDKVVYKSRMHTFHVCECLTVDKEAKVVNLFQATSKDLKSHAFNLTTFKTFLSNLSLVGETAEAKDYTINLICVIPPSREKNSGIVYVSGEEKSGDRRFFGVKSLCESEAELTGRVRGFVVRARWFDDMENFSCIGEPQLRRDIPSCTVAEAWNLWHFGDKASGGRPLRLMSSDHTMTAAKNFSKLKKVMVAMESFLVKDERLAQGQIIEDEAGQLYEYAFAKLVKMCYPNEKQWKMKEKNKFSTFADKLRKCN